MTMQDILTLAKAGYTAAQISALAAAEQEPKQPEPKQPEPKQPEPKQPEPKQQEPKQEPDIIAELREIKSAILAGAYMGAQQPATQDAESALAAIINPPDVLELLGKK